MSSFLQAWLSTLDADVATAWRSAVEAVDSGHVVAMDVVVAVSAVVMALVFAPFWSVWRDRFSRMGWVEKAACAVFLLAAISYGSTKPVYNAGADTGIALVGVFVEYDATNDVTDVEVKFTGNTVGTTTPVSVRNSDRDPWQALVKIDPVVTTDLPTNILSFAASGNVSTNRFWWIGTDTPAVIVDTEGIEITRFAASSKSVLIEWTCDDPKAVEFEVQRQPRGDTRWSTVGTTSSLTYIYVGFTVGETWAWRVISTYPDNTEGGE